MIRRAVQLDESDRGRPSLRPLYSYHEGKGSINEDHGRIGGLKVRQVRRDWQIDTGESGA